MIGLIALLALAASPLSGMWISDANAQKVEGDLVQAIGRAKAIALRNPTGTINRDPVAAVCLNADRSLTVLQSTANTPPDCAANKGEQIWSTRLGEDVTVTTLNPAGNLSCLCFDNKAALTQEKCLACSTTTTFTLVTRGKARDPISIY